MNDLMRHQRGIVNTNVVLLLTRLHDPTVFSEEVLITAVSLAEPSVGPLVAGPTASQKFRAVEQAAAGRAN